MRRLRTRPGPRLDPRVPEPLDYNRAANTTPEVINEFFERFADAMREHRFFEHPERAWNPDETEVTLGSAGSVLVMAPVGQQTVWAKTMSDSRQASFIVPNNCRQPGQTSLCCPVGQSSLVHDALGEQNWSGSCVYEEGVLRC